MKKACSRCGRYHDTNFKCRPDKKIKTGTDESKLRSTRKWTNKSIQIREQSQYLCAVCREQGVYNYDVEVHHIESVKERPDLLLEDTNLICLCKMHHKLAESGEIDKEYLKKLAEKR